MKLEELKLDCTSRKPIISKKKTSCPAKVIPCLNNWAVRGKAQPSAGPFGQDREEETPYDPSPSVGPAFSRRASVGEMT